MSTPTPAGWGSGWDNQVVSLLLLSLSAAGFTGVFGYSPAPGGGNLVFSLTAPGITTDPFGNTVQSGGLDRNAVVSRAIH